MKPVENFPSTISKKWLFAEHDADHTTEHFKKICTFSIDDLIETIKTEGPIINEGFVEPFVFSQYLIPKNIELAPVMSRYFGNHEMKSARLIREVGSIVDDEGAICHRIKYGGIFYCQHDMGMTKVEIPILHEDFTKLWHLSRGKRMTRRYVYLGFSQMSFDSYHKDIGLKIVLHYFLKDKILTAETRLKTDDAQFLPDFGKEITHSAEYDESRFLS